jgi:hypothetical protein
MRKTMFQFGKVKTTINITIIMGWRDADMKGKMFSQNFLTKIKKKPHNNNRV